MHGGMAAGRPASAHLEKSRMVNLPNEELAARDTRPLHLGMAPQAKVGVGLVQQLQVD